MSSDIRRVFQWFGMWVVFGIITYFLFQYWSHTGYVCGGRGMPDRCAWQIGTGLATVAFAGFFIGWPLFGINYLISMWQVRTVAREFHRGWDAKDD